MATSKMQWCKIKSVLTYFNSTLADQFVHYCEEITSTATWGGHLEVCYYAL